MTINSDGSIKLLTDTNGHKYHAINERLTFKLFIKGKSSGYCFVLDGIQYGSIGIYKVYDNIELLNSWCKFAIEYIKNNQGKPMKILKPIVHHITGEYWLYVTRSGMLNIQIYNSVKRSFISSTTELSDKFHFVVVNYITKNLRMLLVNQMQACKNSKLLNAKGVPHKVVIINRLYINSGSKLIQFEAGNSLVSVTFDMVPINHNFKYSGAVYKKRSSRTAGYGLNATRWFYFSNNERVVISKRDYDKLNGLSWQYDYVYNDLVNSKC